MLKNIGMIIISICATPLIVLVMACSAVGSLFYCVANLMANLFDDDQESTISTSSHPGLV